MTSKWWAAVGKAKQALDRARPGHARSDDDSWWDGRQVAIRPDVPGSGLDPGSLTLIRDDDERVEAQAGIERSVNETKQMTPEELWPDWLWEGDTKP